MKIDKLGFIIGGNCDRIHQARRERSLSGKRCIEYLINKAIICETSPGWYRLKKIPAWGWRMIEAKAGEGGANTKIGWYRVIKDLLPLLKKRNKNFRLKWLQKCNEDLQGFEIFIGGDSPLPPFTVRYVPSYNDWIYQERFGKTNEQNG